MKSSGGKLILTLLVIILAIWALQKYTSGGPSAGPRTESDIALGADAGKSAEEKAKQYDRAKEFVDPSGFVNTEPFDLADIIGEKVVLIDFWTYSCINCQRTTPYLNDWYAKYKEKGLEIVGVHTPEFEFEKDIDNVRKAVEKFSIKYPVVLDNDYGTWRAYGNQYWPRKYLIDTDGFIVYDHIGEGSYEETERRIQEALNEHMARLGMEGDAHETIQVPSETIAVDFNKVKSPEVYFGAFRNATTMGSGIAGQEGKQVFAIPNNTAKNRFYLEGPWSVATEYAENLEANARVLFRYDAKDVNIVAGSDKPVRVQVLRDGKPVTTAAGRDVIDGIVTVQDQTLYNLISDPDGYGEHTIELIIQDPGLQLFTFTFG